MQWYFAASLLQYLKCLTPTCKILLQTALSVILQFFQLHADCLDVSYCLLYCQHSWSKSGSSVASLRQLPFISWVNRSTFLSCLSFFPFSLSYSLVIYYPCSDALSYITCTGMFLLLTGTQRISFSQLFLESCDGWILFSSR